jgi:EmrB/QacA subfamily drug resistance transporter
VVLDSTIVNVALPSIQRSLHFSQQSLQWVASGYALTFAGFLLLGGRSADLLGRRRIFLAGIVTFLTASFVGGLANSSGMLIGARIVQGVGGAMMSPAALSLVNTNFEGPDRAKAIGIYGATGGAGGAAGVLFGGLLTSALGWRSVLFVNVPTGLGLLVVASKVVANDRRTAKLRGFDVVGALLVTGALLLLVYTLTQAPNVGWATTRTVLGLVGTAVLVAGFVANEALVHRPLLPLRTFRLPGVVVGNIVAVLVFSAMIPLLFFLTLYMQEVLGYSALQAGVAFLPLTLGVIAVTKNASRLIARFGPRPTLIAGPLVFSAGLLILSRIPPSGHYSTNILPGLLLASVGAGSSLVLVIISATRRVPSQHAGVAAGLINTMQRVGTAVGLAVLTDVAASRTSALIGTHHTKAAALTGGYGQALLVGAGFALVAGLVAAVAARRGTSVTPPPAPVAERAQVGLAAAGHVPK